MPAVLHRGRGAGSDLCLPTPAAVGTLPGVTTDGPGLTGLPGIVGLDHIGLAVADLDAAVAFHTRVLGLRVRHRETNAGQGVEEVMLAADADPGALLVPGGMPPGPSGTQLQLVAPLDDASPVHRFLARRGPGLHHIAYVVVDLSTASDVLLQRGFRLLYDAPRAGTRGSRINFVHPRDTGGVLVELVELAAPHPHGQG